ncbi:MAG: hypothetical protein ABFD07_14345 [Methanobacterium sp.]
MIETDKEFFESIGVKFEDENGKFDDYKYFACSQGVIISNALETKERILEFNNLSWEEQKRLVPAISDDHSGGTWSLAMSAAIAYIPMLLVNRRDKKIDDILN